MLRQVQASGKHQLLRQRIGADFAVQPKLAQALREEDLGHRAPADASGADHEDSFEHGGEADECRTAMCSLVPRNEPSVEGQVTDR